jgi:hypothetical protein
MGHLAQSGSGARKLLCCTAHTLRYRHAMKVAISLPDPVFRAAEQLAHSLCIPRGQLYARAIEEYLDKRQDALITDRLNDVYAKEQQAVEPALAVAQLKAIDREAW